MSPGHGHAALLGSGGLGKTTLAKAVLNHQRIVEHFGTNRFLVRFDNIFSSQITYSTFATHVAQAMGIPTSGSHDVISAQIKQAPTLLVLDNAETFQAVDDMGLINDAIHDFGGFPTVSILITSRRRDLPLRLRWKRFDVPVLDAAAAYKIFTVIYDQTTTNDNASATLQDILSKADHHPLTITLLAHAAQVNSWSIEELSKCWEDQHTRILDTGAGKDFSLAKSIELSLKSPALESFGTDIPRVVRAIATFPQGVRYDNLDKLFQWVPQIGEVVIALQKHSLLSRKDGYITMLVPIRLYIRDAIIAPDPAFLEAARNFYYGEIKLGSDLCKDLIKLDDTNIESLIELDLQSEPCGGVMTALGMGHLKILNICSKFVHLLCRWKPRPTVLFPIVHRVDTSRSSLATGAKFTCFYKLSTLAFTLFTFVEVIKVQEATYELSETLGQEDIMLLSTCAMANAWHLLGQHRKGLKLAQRAQEITKGKGVTPFLRGTLALVLAYTQECVDANATGSSVSDLFYESARSLREGGNTWAANLALADSHFAFALIGDNTELARTELKKMYDTVHRTKDTLAPTLSFLLASASFLEGKFNEADSQLIEAREACKLNEMMPFASIMLLARAILAASLVPSHVDNARNLIAQAKEEAGTYNFVSHISRWVTLYVSGIVEFAADQMDEAYGYFRETEVYCKAHDEFRFRAFSTRAMGEIAYMQGEHYEADLHFQETWYLCMDAGIIPSLLYRPSFFVFCRHSRPATCEGWPRFLEKRPSMVW